jgi:hypothetical protein
MATEPSVVVVPGRDPTERTADALAAAGLSARAVDLPDGLAGLAADPPSCVVCVDGHGFEFHPDSLAGAAVGRFGGWRRRRTFRRVASPSDVSERGVAGRPRGAHGGGKNVSAAGPLLSTT